MEIYEVTTDLGSINLYGFGDLHLGDRNCDMDGVYRTIEKIKNDPYAKVVMMGDLLNCATKASVGKSVYDELMSTEDQWALALKILTPIKDKIIGMLIGNHEFRLEKEGFNPIKTLCIALGVPYLGYSAVLDVHVGNSTYTVYATHGHGGGARGSIVGKLNKLAEVAIADIYMRGHSHQLIYHKTIIRMVENGRLIDKERAVVDTGAFLRYDEGYAEMSSLPMVRTGCAIIKFTSNGFDVTV